MCIVLLRPMLNGLLLSTKLLLLLLPAPLPAAISLLRRRSLERDLDRRRSSVSKRLDLPPPPPLPLVEPPAASFLVLMIFLAFQRWMAVSGSSFHISLASGAAWASLADTSSTAYQREREKRMRVISCGRQISSKSSYGVNKTKAPSSGSTHFHIIVQYIIIRIILLGPYWYNPNTKNI
jgi:hypothetical protein